MLPKLLAIVGPTASGKTELGLKIAKKFKGEIISADSRQIYKGMDIGTAKPAGGRWRKVHGVNAYVVKGVPIFLLDFVNPNQTFTVFQYQKLANDMINRIVQSGRLPILVGGTGLYVKAVVENLLIPAVKPDPKLQKKLNRQLAQKGLTFMYKRLLKLDPEAKKFIDSRNPRRVLRALEVCLATGKPFSSLRKTGARPYDSLIISLKVSRSQLNKKIDQRVDKMIRAGLIKEVTALSNKYGWNSPGLNALGYKEFKKYFAGQRGLEETIAEVKQQTRRYAKRQMTWFRNQHQVGWIKNFSQAQKLAKKFLKA